jgi:hypothetical protein
MASDTAEIAAMNPHVAPLPIIFGKRCGAATAVNNDLIRCQMRLSSPGDLCPTMSSNALFKAAHAA